MKKIKALLDKGWIIELLKHDGRFMVQASHNFWGDVEGWDSELSKAINKMYEDVMKIENGAVEGMYT